MEGISANNSNFFACNNDDDRIESLKKALYEKSLERAKKSRRRKNKFQYNTKKKVSYKFRDKKKKDAALKKKSDKYNNINSLTDNTIERLPIRMSMKKVS
jgi:hypothetical protein